ncbi:RagB/SusD family nutrient uptake outer membrane protein [Reichenbachiella carrageenanivorans]|uniref:RagB/SusD family nutrient uptake outer membrane protein n=1 Tax=Reichenbachiella carrageenanivorans TaxID=2979869 RepID=A0ABY6CW09_9BACT|nr:RagB/SusD family nutrient uptake outer membrane protein [Reichenbachiella carrageenanivorans]UXX78106.1 RagB/SusD family nutrient uptake outer membrane protein [Reichenbachiella carrageenanivorans]
MKNQLVKNIFMILCSIAVWSCSDEDFGLEQVNPNGPSTDNYWSNLDRTESTLISAYSGLLHHDLLGIIQESVRSDLAFATIRTNPSGPLTQWYYQQFLNSDPSSTKRWESQYKVIFFANQVIEGLENLPEEEKADQARWTNQMAQARFLRGLMHFYLHSGFNNGEIIIRDYVPTSLEDFNLETSSSEEVVKFFRADLKYAYQNLPAQNDDGSGAYKATAGAAATALGTSYLYQAEYDSAITVFKDVINNADYGYQLEDHSVLFTEAGENNREAIFEINYTVDFKLDESQWTEESLSSRLARASVNTGNERFSPSAWITDAYQKEPLNTQDARNFVNGNLRPVSLRASQMIALVQDTVTSYYLKSSVPQGIAFNSLTPSYWKKYTNHDIAASEGDTGGTDWKSGRNVTVMRLADVHLMLAEALIQQNNDIAGAITHINKIRDRWALQLIGPDQATGDDYDGVTYDATTLMEHLMYIERPLELSAEGHAIRTIDLRRWGVTKQRFEELAQETYYLTEFEYKDEAGGIAKRNKAYLNKGVAPGNEEVIDYEYDLAASNYIESVHGYLPIPLEEERNNSSQ